MEFLENVDRFSDLTSAIYSASLKPDGWCDALAYIGAQIPGLVPHAFGYDFETGMDLGGLAPKMSVGARDAYMAHFSHVNPWSTIALEMNIGDVQQLHTICAEDFILRSEFYNDWLKPQGFHLYGNGALLFKDQKRFIAFGANIEGNDKQLNQDWYELTKRLVPHLRHAFDISRALAGRRIEKIAYTSGLNEEPAVLVVGGSGGVLYASRQAERLLRDGGLIRYDRLSRLRFTSELQDSKLQRALVMFRSAKAVPPMTFIDRRADQVMELRIAPFRGEIATVSPLGVVNGNAEPSLLVIISRKPDQMEVRDKLRKLYGLSSAEADIAWSIAQGFTTREIAETRDVSHETVRNQLKAAMAKCEVHRQSQLVRAVDIAQGWRAN